MQYDIGENGGIYRAGNWYQSVERTYVRTEEAAVYDDIMAGNIVLDSLPACPDDENALSDVLIAIIGNIYVNYKLRQNFNDNVALGETYILFWNYENLGNNDFSSGKNTEATSERLMHVFDYKVGTFVPF